MSHHAYGLALIHRDRLLREAADRRLATESAATPERVPSVPVSRRPHRLPRLQWLVRASQVSPRLTPRGH
jgi:hypothetical protein